MVQYLDNLVFVAAVGELVGGFIYIRSMLRDGTKPNRVSWLIWAITPFIGTAAEVSNGVGWAALPVFVAGFIPFMVLVASFVVKGAYWRLGPFDYACGALSLLALALWAFTGNPEIAIAFAIASGALSDLPTLRKAWSHPQSESVWTYALGLLNALSAFGAAKLWNFSELAFPTYLVMSCIALIYAVGGRQALKRLHERF